MSAATLEPLGNIDDPEAPGTYVTDGEHLYRLVGAREPRHGYVGMEDCSSLEIVFVDDRELRGWELTPVCQRAMAIAH